MRLGSGLIIVVFGVGCGGGVSGESCRASSDCPSTETCFSSFPNGLCSKTCVNDADCGGDSCQHIANDFVCLKHCSKTTQCRADLTCGGPRGAFVCGGLCTRVQAAYDRLFAGRTDCSIDGGSRATRPPASTASCDAALGSCSAVELPLMDAYARCLEDSPVCVSGGERLTLDRFGECGNSSQFVGVSAACIAAFQ